MGITTSSFAGCPTTAPGQHPLGAVSGPADPAENDWYGCGDGLTPGGPGLTGANWTVSYALTCPDADAVAPPAMGVGMIIESWVYAGGGKPLHHAANDVTVDLPWADNGSSLVPDAGDYRLKLHMVNGAAGDGRCRWHVRAKNTAPA